MLSSKVEFIIKFLSEPEAVNVKSSKYKSPPNKPKQNRNLSISAEGVNVNVLVDHCSPAEKVPAPY